MTRIFLFILVLGFAGCASTVDSRKALQPAASSKDEYVSEMQGSNVYAALKGMLQRGATVNVMVEYESAYDGLPKGYLPDDFGCETDSTAVIETEKLFLLDSFVRYPNFNVIDRSQMNASFAEMKLGMSQVTESNIFPGQVSGVSHIIVVEGRNHFFSLSGKNKVRYTEIKKLLDIQRNIVIAMDKIYEVRNIQYARPPSRVVTLGTHVQSQDFPAVQGAGELQQLPPVIGVGASQVSESKTEVITIRGPVIYLNQSQSVKMASTTPQHLRQSRNNQPNMHERKIQDWQLARIVKQRFPNLKDKDDKVLVQHFIKTHPEFKGRIIDTK